MVYKIAIRIMLDHVAGGIPPIVKNLRAQDMTTNAPNRLILLLGKPLVTQCLRVKIVHFE